MSARQLPDDVIALIMPGNRIHATRRLHEVYGLPLGDAIRAISFHCEANPLTIGSLNNSITLLIASARDAGLSPAAIAAELRGIADGVEAS